MSKQLFTQQRRNPTHQELRALHMAFHLEQISDDLIGGEVATLIRNLRFDHATTEIIENCFWEHSGRHIDTAIVLWHNPKWCMIFCKLAEAAPEGMPEPIHWLCVYNCNPESLLAPAL